MNTDSLWTKIKQGLRDGASTAAERAEYLGRLGRARLDMARTRHDIHDVFTELGGHVYDQLKDDETAAEAQTEAIQKNIQTIRELEQQLQSQEQQFKALQEADDAPKH